MTKQRRFPLDKAPFIRKADNKRGIGDTRTMMIDFIIALAPLIIFAWVKNGLIPFLNPSAGYKLSFIEMLYPLLFILAGGLFSYLLEAFYYAVFEKLEGEKLFNKLYVSYATIPGLLLAMVLSHNTPIWVLFIGCIFATVIGKLLFGGFGHNLFNPALLGYLFVGVAYMSVINSSGGFLNTVEVDAIVSATPLQHFASNKELTVDQLIEPYGSVTNLFIGLHPGSGAETSALLCIVAAIYLSIRRVIDWRVPLIYVAVVFVLSYLIGAFQGYATDLRYPLFHIFTGGLMFGAVFMATEPVTGPRTPNGRIIYALALGVLTVLFRFVGAMPEGVATAIITMNLFAVIIDRVCAKLRVTDKVGKIVLTYSLIFVLLAGISAYSISQAIKPDSEADLVNIVEVE